MNNLSNQLLLPEVSIDSLIVNLIICVFLSMLMCWHFSKRAQKRFLRRDLGLILPVIALTTLLVISVVKSSLALSLGLVGALSIVRFRTPIKEPEELAYIFLAIAVGLALGADQREVAAITLFIILIIISIIDRFRPSFTKPSGDLLLNMIVDKKNNSIESIVQLVESICPEADIKRVEQDHKSYSVIALIKVIDSSFLTKFTKEFDHKFPSGRFSIIDDTSLPIE
jgi:hypothetical protein